MLRDWMRKTARVERVYQLLRGMRAYKYALGAAFAFATFSCSGAGNQAISSGTLGLQITAIAGNNQAQAPSAVYPEQLNIQITDAVDGLPVPYVTVNFTALDSTDAEIIIPSVTTDNNGMALTTVRAPSAIDSVFHVQAAIAGTQVATQFTLSTLLSGTSTHYVVDTTHSSIETAGVPFSYIVRIVDAAGATVTNYSGSVEMIWEVQTNTSWAVLDTALPASTNVLPPSTMLVNFVNGVFTTPATYVLTDSRAVTQVWLGDSQQSIEDTQAHQITVLPNSAYALLIAKAAGGPTAGATIFPSTGVDFTSDQTLQTFYGAVVDNAGNYISDVANATWTISNESFKDPGHTGTWDVVNSFTPTVGGNAASITPTVTGGGTLTVSLTGLQPATTPIAVDPGVPSKVALSTQHSSVEQAGVHFSINVQAVDAKGNLLSGNSLTGAGAYTGDYPVVFTVQNGRDVNHKLSTCRNMIGASGDFTAIPITTYASQGVCSGTSWETFVANPTVTTETFNLGTVTFINGQSNSTVNGQLNWLTSYGLNNILIGATLTPTVLQNLPTLTGTVGPITVNPSYPVTFNLFDQPISNSSPNPICQRTYQEYFDYNTVAANSTTGNFDLGGPLSQCPTLQTTSGSGTQTYYAGLEDQGGNLYSPSAPSVSVQGFGNSNNDWSSGANATVYFNPIVASTTGAGVVIKDNTTRAVSSSGTAQIATTIYDSTAPLNLNHYALSVSDGSDPTNVISAIGNYSIQVVAQDVNNNQVGALNGPVTLTFTSVDPTSNGAVLASPNGTAAVVPAASAQNYNFGGGSVNVSTNVVSGLALRTPNVSGIKLTVTDLNGITGSLTPVVIPGPISSLQIRDAAGGTGNNLTNQAVNLTTTSNETFYVTGIDAVGNILNGYSSGTWTDQHTSPNYALNSLGNLAGITFPTTSSSVNFVPTAPGSGMLTVTSSGGVTASTGVITVSVSPVAALKVVNQHHSSPGYESAGSSFTTSVSLVDANNNVVSYNGSLMMTAAVLGNANTITGYSNGAVPGGGSAISCNFVNGVMSPSPSFTLYNSAVTPVIYYRVSSGTVGGADVSGISGSESVTVHPVAANNIYMSTGGVTNVGVENTVTYQLSMVDQYGNVVTSGTGSNQSVTVDFADSLTNHEITATTLTGATPTPSVGGGVTSLTGALTNGYATVTVRAKQTGTIMPRVVTGNGSMDALLVTADIQVVPGTPDHLLIATNANASYAAGTGIPLVVQIQDAYNNVVNTGSESSSTIALTLAQAGNGSPPSLQGATSISAVNGVATFASGTGGSSSTAYVTVPNLSPNPTGVYSLTVAKTSGVSLSSLTSSTFSVTAGTATQLVFTQSAPASVTANTVWASANRPIINIEDAWGNVVTTGAQSSQTIYLYPYKQSGCPNGQLGTPSALLPGAPPSVAAVAGVANFNGLALQYTDATTSSNFYLQANNASGLATCASSGTSITAGTATKIANYNYPSGNTSTTTVSSAVSPTPQFQVQDAYGNGVSGVTVNFAFGTLPPGSPTSQALSVSSASSVTNGLVSVGVTVGNKVGVSGNVCSNGTYPVIASSSGLSSATLNAIAVAGNPTQLAFVNSSGSTVQPQATGNGQMVGQAFQNQGNVQVQDTNGNCVASAAATTVTLSPFTSSSCSTAASGVTLANNTATTSSGTAGFSGLYASALSSTAGTAFYLGANASGFSQICTTVSSPIWNQLSVTPSGSQTTTTGTTINFAASGGVGTLSWSLPATNSASSGVSGCLGPYTAAVTVGSQGWCPSTASSCVTYTPGCVGGGSSDAIRVQDSSWNSITNNVTVNGPQLSILNSTNPNWGTDSTNVTQTFTVQNTGNAAMSTGSLITPVLSPDAYPGTNRFVVNDVSCASAVLAVGATCTFQVTFQPCGSGVCPTDPQGYPDGYTFTEPSGALHVDANPGGRATISIIGTKQ